MRVYSEPGLPSDLLPVSALLLIETALSPKYSSLTGTSSIIVSSSQMLMHDICDPLTRSRRTFRITGMVFVAPIWLFLSKYSGSIQVGDRCAKYDMDRYALSSISVPSSCRAVVPEMELTICTLWLMECLWPRTWFLRPGHCTSALP